MSDYILEAALRERDHALQQATLAWQRHAEKDAAYQKALNERDQWREVAGKMATAITLYGNSKLVESLNAYDALAKLSEKP